MKDHYKKNGYSVVAFTDHDVLIPHQALKDADFLPLNGVVLTVANAKNRNCRAEEELITQASLSLSEYAQWIRVTVWDANGKFAISRAYFPEEWEG